MITWLRVSFSRISDDIRHKENLEVYVTLLVAALVLLIDIAGYDRFTAPAVLAVLLLITYGQLNNKKLQEKQQRDLEDLRKAIAQLDSEFGAKAQTDNKPDAPPPPLKRHDEDSSSIDDIAHKLDGDSKHIELVAKKSTPSHDRYTVRLLADTVVHVDHDKYYSSIEKHSAGDTFVATVHRQTRSLLTVTKMVPDQPDVVIAPLSDLKPASGLAYVLSILFGGLAIYLAVQLRDLVESTYAIYGTEALVTVPTVVGFASLAIILVPPMAFIWGATAGQPPRIANGSTAALLLIPVWGIVAVWLSLIPFQSQLPLDRSGNLMWIFQSAESFRAYFVSGAADSSASNSSAILVHGIFAVVFGLLTVTMVFAVGEGIHFVAGNLDFSFNLDFAR